MAFLATPDPANAPGPDTKTIPAKSPAEYARDYSVNFTAAYFAMRSVIPTPSPAESDATSSSSTGSDKNTSDEAVRPGDRGTYSGLKQRKNDFGQTEPVEMHEMPSYAAKKEAYQQKYGHYPQTSAERKMVRDAGVTEAVTPDVHRQTRTYGGKNNASQIQNDAADLEKARELDEQDLFNLTQ